jgi:hypothetical protein
MRFRITMAYLIENVRMDYMIRAARSVLSTQYSGAKAAIIRSSTSTAPDGADSGSVGGELGHP